jgi:hypothetical protein
MIASDEIPTRIFSGKIFYQSCGSETYSLAVECTSSIESSERISTKDAQMSFEFSRYMRSSKFTD